MTSQNIHEKWANLPHDMSFLFQKLLNVKLYELPLEVVYVHRVHRGAVAQHSSDNHSLSSCCSSAVVAWSKVVEDLNPADLWILFIMSTDY